MTEPGGLMPYFAGGSAVPASLMGGELCIYEPWLSPSEVVQLASHYRIRGQDLARVTRILKIVGTGTEGLVRWSANVERAAVLEAATETWIEQAASTPAAFAFQLEQRLGKARQHQIQLGKAADIGTKAHHAIKDWLQSLIEGRDDSLASDLPEASLIAAMAFQDWFRKSGLKPLRMEQAVWDAQAGYAGTVDLIAEGPQGVGIVDLKTSKGLWDTYHMQVAAYMHAARRHAPIAWGLLVRVPKDIGDPILAKGGVEVKEVGKMVDRTLTEAQCYEAFLAAVKLWNLLVEKP